jgi:PncC family amidohydrolase
VTDLGRQAPGAAGLANVVSDGVAELVAALRADGATVAAAESLTGGRLIAALTCVPGSSAVVRGAVVAYASDLKTRLLGVDEEVLATQGPVCAEVAEQMAVGARDRLVATYGIATTGEAGPDTASGRPIGTVVVAVAGPRGTTTRHLDLRGTRAQIQAGAVADALRLLAEVRSGGPDTQGSADGAGLGNNRD